MATSSIFNNVVLKTEEDVKNFLDAAERSEKDFAEESKVEVEYVDDDATLSSFLDKVVSKIV